MTLGALGGTKWKSYWGAEGKTWQHSCTYKQKDQTLMVSLIWEKDMKIAGGHLQYNQLHPKCQDQSPLLPRTTTQWISQG